MRLEQVLARLDDARAYADGYVARGLTLSRRRAVR
jgi:hypothetical protein